MDIKAFTGGGDLLSEKEGAAIAEAGEVAELVAGISLSDGLCARGRNIPCEEGGVFLLGEDFRIESEGAGDVVIENDQFGRGNRCQLPSLMEEGREMGVGMVEIPALKVSGGIGGHGLNEKGYAETLESGNKSSV